MLEAKVASALNAAARKVGESPNVEDALNSILDAIQRSLPDFDHAGVSVTTGQGAIETRAWVGELTPDLDQIQYEVGEGPCLDAIDQSVRQDVVRAEHLRREQRWPRYVPEAVRRGLRSQLGLRLHTGGETFGSLNLYSTRSDVVTPDSARLAEIFATHAAVALRRVRTEDQLTMALTSRTVIGQATGIVMERYRLDPRRAFEYLVRLSQTSNIRVRDVAAQLVEEVARGGDDGAG